MSITLDGRHLSLSEAERILWGHELVQVSPQALSAVQASAEVVAHLVERGEPVYGINTGFGKLSRQRVPASQLGQLQINLLRSHAVGVGAPLPDEAARAALLFRLNALLLGRSGVRPQLTDYLARLLNEGAVPLIPSKGSVGSSGDLAPLAHLSLLLIGEGEAKLAGRRLSGRELLSKLELEPLQLAPKEGLALINGTQISLAVGFVAWHQAKNLLEHAQLISALALEAFGGRVVPFDARLQDARPHSGQRRVAQALRQWLSGSQLVEQNDDVQDPYTLRCIPQVLGASAEAFDWVAQVMTTEINSATDNPLIFAESGEALSGGNFHGQILALAFELLGMATAEIGNFSERRSARLLEAPGLPPFLADQSGLDSGLMITQYTAAALVSENKVLAHPAVVDSIPTSGGQEDHNSLCSLSAQKALQIAENVEYILAIELLIALQALDYRGSAEMAPATRRAYQAARARLPHWDGQGLLGEEIQKAKALIARGELLHA
jgi:histidine ammonia-lyase